MKDIISCEGRDTIDSLSTSKDVSLKILLSLFLLLIAQLSHTVLVIAVKSHQLMLISLLQGDNVGVEVVLA